MHHFGNHVTGATHDYRVADSNILALDLVLVVQGRVRDRNAADKYRLETRDRCQGSGAPDLYIDVDEPGHFFFRRELVRDRPARRARYKSKRILLFYQVDLEHHAIDVIRK